MPSSIEQFVQRLSSSGLMSAEEVRAFAAALSKDQQPVDANSLSDALVSAEQLTPFQARALHQGQTDRLVLGHYVILDKLGEGGMGEVYKGRHIVMDREVAIKILPEKAVDSEASRSRFLQEVKTAARLTHPNIVITHDAAIDDDLCYLVMEYVVGRDLSRLLAEQGRLDWPLVAKCLQQAARGLAYAHSRKIVHRDIKPSNLMLTADGAVKVLDMGLARMRAAVEDATSREQLTNSGQVMGTVDYISPEQARNTHAADHRSDIYSLGCTLFTLVAGRVIYPADSIVNKLMAHQQAPVPSLRQIRPDVPERFDQLFQRLVAKKPAERPQSMEEVAAALEQCLVGTAVKHSRLPDSATRARPGVKTKGKPPASPAEAKTMHSQANHETRPSRVTAARDQRQPLGAVSVAPAPSLANVERERLRRDQRTLLAVIGAVSACLAFLGAAAGLIVWLVSYDDPVGTLLVEGPVDEVALVYKAEDWKQFRPLESDQRNRYTLAPGRYRLGVGERFEGKYLVKPAEFELAEGSEVAVEILKRNTKDDVPASAKPMAGPPPPLAVAPFDAAGAKLHQRRWASYLGVPVERDIELRGRQKVTMVLIPPGEFQMGSREDENAAPQHRVRINLPFYLGKYEVTQAQWQAVLGGNPSEFNQNLAHPVEQVSWDDVQPFLAELNDDALVRDLKFVLPTEAQWEFACRAGTTTYWHSGDSPTSLREFGWFKMTSGGKTHPVGQLQPNAFDLYDTCGNVWEWCADLSAADYFANSPTNDPSGPTRGWRRILRGGDWNSLVHSGDYRLAHRYWYPPDHRYSGLGFRLAAVFSPEFIRDSLSDVASDSIRDAAPHGDYALEFDGESNYVSSPVMYDGRRPFTWEMWVTNFDKPESGDGGSRASLLLSTTKADNGRLGFLPSGHVALGLFSRSADTDGARSRDSIISQSAILGRRLHVAGVFDGRQLRLFVDGKQAADPVAAAQRTRGVASPICLGALISKSSPESVFRGIIDEVRISSVARYEGDFQPMERLAPDEDTLALYYCDEGEGDVLRDSSGKGHHGKIFGAIWVDADSSPWPVAFHDSLRHPKAPQDFHITLGQYTTVTSAGVTAEPGGLWLNAVHTGSAIWLKKPVADRYGLEIKFAFGPNSKDPRAHFWFSGLGHGNFEGHGYFLRISRDGGILLRNGKTVRTFRFAEPLSGGQFYQLKFERDEDRFSLWIDHEHVLTFVDRQPLVGALNSRIGFGVDDHDHVYFKELTLRQPRLTHRQQVALGDLPRTPPSSRVPRPNGAILLRARAADFEGEDWLVEHPEAVHVEDDRLIIGDGRNAHPKLLCKTPLLSDFALEVTFEYVERRFPNPPRQPGESPASYALRVHQQELNFEVFAVLGVDPPSASEIHKLSDTSDRVCELNLPTGNSECRLQAARKTLARNSAYAPFGGEPQTVRFERSGSRVRVFLNGGFLFEGTLPVDWARTNAPVYVGFKRRYGMSVVHELTAYRLEATEKPVDSGIAP